MINLHAAVTKKYGGGHNNSHPHTKALKDTHTPITQTQTYKHAPTHTQAHTHTHTHGHTDKVPQAILTHRGRNQSILGVNGARENTFFFQKMNKCLFFFSVGKVCKVIIIHDKNAV